jgi:adenine C2-methylase RlmN of 23S rRNA A2503 and tRNA A37
VGHYIGEALLQSTSQRTWDSVVNLLPINIHNGKDFNRRPNKKNLIGLIKIVKRHSVKLDFLPMLLS